jgi:alpha-N-arabinofuranosidase
MIVTPSYHVLEMYRHHQAGESVRVLVDSPTTGSGVPAVTPVVAGSASLKDGRLFLTLTNAHIDQPVDVEVVLLGVDRPSVRRAAGRQLAGADVHDHNSFDRPESVQPLDVSLSWKGGDRSTLRLPAHSVSALELELA